MNPEQQGMAPSLSSNMEADGASFRPHDLLWIADGHALQSDEPFPPWVTPHWLQLAPVVVRRERVERAESVATIPVGLRGMARSERVAAYLRADAVTRRASPEMLAQEACWKRLAAQAVPALAALARLAPLLDALGLPWGPTGSTGFALATGLPVLREQSDLDLVIRSALPLTSEQTRSLRAASDGEVCRIDIQIDTGHGAFAFAEWTARRDQRDRVLLKTDDGPVLTPDPWAQRAPSVQQAA